MRVSELYNQVAQLGFEDSLEDDDRFYYAANRALLQVCKIRPAVSHYVLNHRPLSNSVKESTFAPIERTENLTFEADGVKSYYFEADGNGVLYVEKLDSEDNTWSIVEQRQLASSGAFVKYRGLIKEGNSFITGRVRLRLSGEYLYSVRNVALYKHLLSANVADIPDYEAFTRYDIRSAVTDFLALCCPPIMEGTDNVILNQDYQMEGDSIILLPYNKKGVFKVLYERLPNSIVDTGNVSEDTAVIDLDNELCTLLPILIAAYVWIDDEPSKSEYYMNLYRERAAEVERKTVNNQPVKYKNTTGW